MAISSISGDSQLVSQAQNNASGAATNQLMGDMDTFLTLLTTQLQNQDPTAPMDSNEFLDQIGKFSEVEQAIATNQNLEQLIALQQNDRQLRSLDYIGAQIEAVGDTNMLQDGTASWKYSLGADASTVTLRVIDQAGRAVRTEYFGNQTGLREYVWDGRDDEGTVMDDGAYTLLVTAVDADKEDVPVTTGIGGTVDSVDIGDDNIYLRIGDVQVPLDTLTNVTRN